MIIDIHDASPTEILSHALKSTFDELVQARERFASLAAMAQNAEAYVKVLEERAKRLEDFIARTQAL
jgi:hypothetical protein